MPQSDPGDADVIPSGWTRFRPARRYRRLIRPAGARAYAMTLALPAAPPPPGGYAALVTLDGATHFDILAGTAAALTGRPAKTRVGPTVVVGLAPLEGSRELAYPFGPPAAPEAVPGPVGDGAGTLAVLAGRVLPRLRAAAPIDPARLGLFGHSLGGLFALEAMAAQPDLFARWMVVSPSVWWRPQVVQDAAAAISGQGSGQGRVMLACGAREMAVVSPRRMGERLEATARALGTPLLRLADEDHGSAAIAAMPAALRFLHADPAVVSP